MYESSVNEFCEALSVWINPGELGETLEERMDFMGDAEQILSKHIPTKSSSGISHCCRWDDIPSSQVTETNTCYIDV